MTILEISSPSLTSCRAKIRKKKTLKWDENDYLCICRAHWPYFKWASTIVIVYIGQRGKIHFKNVFTLFYFVYRPQSRTLPPPPQKKSFYLNAVRNFWQCKNIPANGITFSLITFTLRHKWPLITNIQHSFLLCIISKATRRTKRAFSESSGWWLGLLPVLAATLAHFFPSEQLG